MLDLLGTFTLSEPLHGHIPNSPKDMRDAIEHQRFEADIDREFGAIFAQPKELQTNTHGSCAWGGEIAIPVQGMDVTKALRQEHLKGVSKQFRACIAKGSLKLLIHHHDHASLTDNQ